MRVLQQPGSTCLLRSLLSLLTLLITCTEAHPATIIQMVTLSVEPATEVERGVNLTLTCTAIVSHTSGDGPDYKYSFFKDSQGRELADMSPTDNVDHVVYSIPNARAFHSGTYQCKLVVGQQIMESNTQEIVVKGLQTPVLHVDKAAVREGEAVSITCRAEDEVGLLGFSIKDGSQKIYWQKSDAGSVQMIYIIRSVRTVNLTCSFFIDMKDQALQSNISNVVTVAVQELDITPHITVLPQTRLIEGDHVHITCSVNPHDQNGHLLSLFLIKETLVLKVVNMTNTTYSTEIQAADSGEYKCSALMGNVQKASSINLTVKELFSQPKVIITPSDVFEGQDFTVGCYSTDFASERIRREDVKYSILRNKDNLTLGQFNGMYKAVAGTETNGNYTCSAQVSSIIKRSTSMTFTAKVLVSRPIISAVGQVILGRPFQILCHSENGSFPINYTLKWNHVVLNHSVSTQAAHEALFTAVIRSEAEIHQFTCGAQNYHLRLPLTSKVLSTPVIVPVQESFLTVVPTPEDITEGQDIYFICSTRRGTPPITFRWYRQGSGSPLFTITVSTNSSSYTLKDVHKEDSGTYYCEAQNHDNAGAPSNMATFTVRMARWKKALIIGACLLGVALVLMVVLIRYGAKRVRVSSGSKASVWSERPPAPAHCGEVGDTEEPEPNVEYAEVMHSKAVDPALVPLKKGTDTVYSEVQTTSQGFGGVY